MGKGFFQVPIAYNEPIKSYAPGTPEREAVLQQYKEYFEAKVNPSIVRTLIKNYI